MTADKVGVEAWAMYALVPQAEYERMLRVYRAWQGAAVVEIDGSGEEVRLIAVGSELDNSIASARIDAMHGTRVRLVPDGGQGA